MIWSVLALYLTWFYTDVYGLNAGGGHIIPRYSHL